MERVERATRCSEGSVRDQPETEHRCNRNRQQVDDRKKQEKKRAIKIGWGENEEDGDDEDEVLDGVGVCGVCRLAATGIPGPGGSSMVYSCAQGHLLCQQCVRRFAIRSDMGCILCGTNLYNSSSSNSSLTQTNAQTSKILGVQGRALPPVKELHVNPWFQGYGTVETTGNDNAGSISDWEEVVVDRNEQLNNDETYHQQRSYCSLMKERNPDPREQTGLEINKKDTVMAHTECSRRPIRCPRLDCSVNVAFSALTHHFLFDHPEVPILSVEPGVKSTLIVSFAALSCDSSRCLALLLVSGKVSGSTGRLFSGSQIHPKYRNRLPLPVLAARLHCTSRYAGHEESHGEGDGEGDMVIAWVAGLDIDSSTTGALRCSIQAVDGGSDGPLRSLTYTGPVNSLRTAQRPREVFLTGDCVILHEGFINHITSGCTSLNVNVIVL